MNNRHQRTEVVYLLLVAYIAVLAVYLLGPKLVAYADCPACFKNETPAPSTPDAQGGRSNYSVLVDLTAGDGRYRTALALAMGAWNNAQGTGGTEASIGFKLYDPTPDANGNAPPLPQVMIQLGGLGTNSKGEKICAKTQAVSFAPNPGDPPGPTVIQEYVITLPPEAANWSLSRIAEVIEHEIGHVLGDDDVNQGCSSIMQQGSADCKTSVHTTIEARDVDAARNYAADRANCNKDRGTTNYDDSSGGGGGGGDQCATNPCCNDPECCGDPNCGNHYCSYVCEEVCSRYCDEFDPETGECLNWSEYDCQLGNCHEECY